MQQTIAELTSITRNVGGWLKQAEGELLYRLAKGVTGRGSIVEIGSWKGRSTIWLGRGTQEGSRTRIYAIDPHTGAPEHKKRMGQVWTFDEFRQNIQSAGVDDMIEPIVKTSEEAARSFDRPIEFIFIDGAHEYEAVKLDFELWYPKVLDGGVMAFHDTTNRPGPSRLVEEQVYTSRHFKDVHFVESITYGTKVAQNTLGDRIGNYLSLANKRLFELRRKFTKKKGGDE